VRHLRRFCQTHGSPRVRRDLLQPRERAWRAFFENDPATLDQLLGPELIAIQETQERWENRERLVEMATKIRKQGIRILRLEFPQTEIQVFGKTAILYYTYVFETGSSGQPSAVSSGRGTEVFVLRKGKWIDVGWHLDNGAFRFRNGVWTKMG
jgi:Domain of unknown function (DUF4440)